MDKDIDELFDPSRRSLMKKAALSSGALALGLGSGTTAGASSAAQPSQTLMFTHDYESGRTLQVVASLQQSVTRQILGQQIGDDGGQIISDTSEWTTTLAQYTVQGGGPGEYVLVFTRGGQLEQGSEYQASSPVSFFNEEFGLLEVTLSSGGGSDGGNDTETTADDDGGSGGGGGGGDGGGGGGNQTGGGGGGGG